MTNLYCGLLDVVSNLPVTVMVSPQRFTTLQQIANWVCPVSTDSLPLGHSTSSQSNLFVL